MKIFLWLFLSGPATSCLTEGSLLSVATVGFCLPSLQTFVIEYEGVLAFFLKWPCGFEGLPLFTFQLL